MAKLDTKQNFSIPSSDSERDKIILLAVKVLAEKEGGNVTLNQLLAKTDNLTYEEIMASTNLTGKVASASALKDYDSKRYLRKYYSDAEVNSFGGFENTIKDFVNNYLKNDNCYTGIVTINSQFAFTGQKYASGLYGAFLFIGFNVLYLVQLNNGAFTFRTL